ncbi:TRAP transporter substrate-binding protein DctP [Reyranella sp.]|uniref:TRAP transporter substrate-binding protein DctP n=1 Tax=Reyranella sp. TaxID=1929291 RepID=UPI003BAD818C
MRAVVFAVIVALVTFGQPTFARDIISSDIYPSSYPTVRATAYMGDLIRERSGGRLILSNLGAGDRESENYTLGQLRNGTLDMARLNINTLNSAVPATIVPTLPYIFRSVAHEREVLDGPVGEEILASLEATGVVGLCFYDGGAKSIYGNRPIRSPADLRGLRYRVQPSAHWAPMLRALGAQPVPMPQARVEAAMRAGVIDLADGSWSSFVALQHHSVAKNFSLTEHSRPPSVLLFSKRIWDTLSPEDRAILKTAARDSVALYRQLSDEHEAAARREAEAAGVMTVSDIDYDGFAAALVPYYATAVSDPRLKAMIERIKGEAGR